VIWNVGETDAQWRVRRNLVSLKPELRP